MVIISCAAAATSALTAFATVDMLYAMSVLGGLTYGSHWALVPAITSEVFGLSSFGTNYNLVTLGTPIAAYALATELVSCNDSSARSQSVICRGTCASYQLVLHVKLRYANGQALSTQLTQFFCPIHDELRRQ